VVNEYAQQPLLIRHLSRYCSLMRNLLLIFLAASLQLAFLTPPTAAFSLADDPPAAIPATNASAPQPYTRITNPDTNTVQLQIAVRKFTPEGRSGATIWLVGTSHVGEPDYYKSLQKHLDGQTVVLYEGVNADAHPRHVGKEGEVSPRPPPVRQHLGKTNDNSSMQGALAASLGLVFQLDAINYDRTNFLNSDLSILEIQRLMIGDSNAVPAAPGEKGVSNSSFDNLLQIMDGSSVFGSLLKAGMQFIGSSPKLQAITKLTFVEALGHLKGDFSEIHGLPPDLKQLLKVLIEARNKQVIEDLKTELKVVPNSGSISVFYGTGHMDDMERRVVHDLKYRPAGDSWFTAFSVDVRKTGLSPDDLQSLRKMVQWQMDQMQR
jgi:hypothetical protein